MSTEEQQEGASPRVGVFRGVPRPLLVAGILALGFVIVATVLAFGYGHGTVRPETVSGKQMQRLLDPNGKATTPLGFYRVDEPAPNFALAPVSGTTPVDLAHLTGHPIVLNFWYSTCPPCAAEAPALASVAKATAGRVTFVGVDFEDNKASAAKFTRQHGESYPDGFDPSGKVAIGLYGIPGTPTTYFLSPNGKTELAVSVGAMTERGLEHDLRVLYGVRT